jgi:hypothetical protein
MFRRDTRFSRLRDERVARLYNKSLLLKILFVILNSFWISNDDFGINQYLKKIPDGFSRRGSLLSTSSIAYLISRI